MPTKTDIRSKLNFWVWVICLLLLPAIAHAGGLGMAVLAAIIGGTGYISNIGRLSLQQIPGWFWMTTIFLIWAAITSVWSPYHDTQFLRNPMKIVLGYTLFCGAFLSVQSLTAIQISRIFKVLVFAFFVMSVLLILDLVFGLMVTNLFDPPNQDEIILEKNIQTFMNLGHSVALATMMFPLVVWGLGNGNRARYLFATAILGVILLGVAWAGKFNVGIIFLLLFALSIVFTKFSPRFSAQFFVSASIVLIVLAPLLYIVLSIIPVDLTSNLPTSWEHRVVMWKYVSSKIPEALLLGHGFDSVRVLGETYIGNANYEMTIVSLHPHNFGIHIWYETGMIGAILAGLSILFVGKEILNQLHSNPGFAIPICGFVASLIVLGTVSYGVWQEWLWASVIFFAALYSKLPVLMDSSSS